MFIRACIFLKRFLGARLIYLLNILNTSHIERLLNTYYAASAGDPLERNKQVIANTLESHTRVISGIHWRNKRGSRHLKGRGVRYDFIENVALELSLRSCLYSKIKIKDTPSSRSSMFWNGNMSYLGTQEVTVLEVESG